MAGTDPWTGARLDDDNDAPLGGSYLARVVTDLRSYVGARFATQAARDAATTALATAGSPVVNGMFCWTDDTACFWDRIGGVWAQRPHFGDTGPQTITPVAGWTPITTGSDPGLSYRVVNGLCEVNFHLNGVGSWAGGNTVFTMPSGAQPVTTKFLRVTKDNSDGVADGLMSIHTNGTAVINFPGSAGNDIYGGTSYFTP